MTRSRGVPVVALAVALAALAGSIAWAVSRDGGWSMWSHHTGRGAWMMGYRPSGSTQPVKGLDDARARAQAFAGRLGLRTDEVLQFERNYYVKLVDPRGHDATEVLVDPPTGTVSLEYGPAMAWNTKYGFHRAAGAGRGMMGGRRPMTGSAGSGMMSGSGPGMMGGVATGATSRPSSIGDARSIAQRWLDANEPGVNVESGGDSFPGYFTFETLRDGRIDGMISVNAATGAVWPHWWHGAFVREA